MVDIPAPPGRMSDLRRDHRGYVVPWFVKWFDDKPDFRMIAEHKFTRAVKQRLCWCCGKQLGRYLAFVIGPMCAITRTTSEPPNHLECATYAATVCPFLANPRMHRQEHNLPEHVEAAGMQLYRNPGVACVWVSRDYAVFNAGRVPGSNPGILIEVGDPTEVSWYANGQAATPAEIWQSIGSGLPALIKMAKQDPQPIAAMTELERCVRTVEKYVPPSEIDLAELFSNAVRIA